MDRPTHGAGAADLERLAEDWITLWQSELVALAADREVAEGWSVGLAAWMAAARQGWHGGAAPAAAPPWPAPWPATSWPPFPGWPQPGGAAPSAPMPGAPMPGWNPAWAPPGWPGLGAAPPWPFAPPHEQQHAAAAPGAPPAAAAPGAGDGARDGRDDGDPALRQQLEQLERRLAALEGRTGGSGTDRF